MGPENGVTELKTNHRKEKYKPPLFDSILFYVALFCGVAAPGLLFLEWLYK